MSDNGSPISTSVDATYAQALIELAAQAGKLDQIADELDQVGQIWKRESNLQRLLSSLVLSAARRAQVIENLFKGRLSDTLYRFLQVVNQKGRMGRLPSIIRAFCELLDKRHGVVRVDAFVAQRMDEQRLNATAQRIGTALGRRVVLHQYEQPHLIGGLKLRAGDHLIDGSVDAQLRIMKNKLIAVGRDRARQGTAE